MKDDKQLQAFQMIQINQLVEQKKTFIEKKIYLEKILAETEQELEIIQNKLNELDPNVKALQRNGVGIGWSFNQSDGGIKSAIITLLDFHGKAITRNQLDHILTGKTPTSKTKDVIRRMKERKELVSVIYNNSVMFTFIALPQWIDHGILLDQYRPDRNDLPTEIRSVEIYRKVLKYE